MPAQPSGSTPTADAQAEDESEFSVLWALADVLILGGAGLAFVMGAYTPAAVLVLASIRIAMSQR